jgi:succinate dehydrogenase/fumarate reductase cytochrome b subunit
MRLDIVIKKFKQYISQPTWGKKVTSPDVFRFKTFMISLFSILQRISGVLLVSWPIVDFFYWELREVFFFTFDWQSFFFTFDSLASTFSGPFFFLFIFYLTFHALNGVRKLFLYSYFQQLSVQRAKTALVPDLYFYRESFRSIALVLVITAFVFGVTCVAYLIYYVW